MAFSLIRQKQLRRDRGDGDSAYQNAYGRYRASVVRHRLGIDIVFELSSRR